MGHVKRMLHSAQLAKSEPDLYADKRSIELAESMHVHERNVRLEYDGGEFAETLNALDRALDAWTQNGCDDPRPGRETVWLDVSDIDPEPGVTPQRFDIEESEYPTLSETTIHLHYRSLRLEFSHAEWLEFAEGVATALGRWHS